MSRDIKTLFPNAIIKGNKNTPRSGAFEITLNNQLIYSKFQTNSFPTKNELKRLLSD